MSFTFSENPASQTLLIPLAIRAQEGSHPKALFADRAAEETVARLPADAFNFSIHPFMRIGTSVRVRYFNDLAKDFLRTAEYPIVIQLGCGLDTRFSRIDSGKGVHVNIDLPKVMALRRQVFPSGAERDIDWAGDLLERDWMDRLENNYASRQLLFIAEGVLMYLSENDVRKLIQDIAKRFPGSHMAFDTVGRLAARVINKKSAVQQLKASLNWVYDDDGSLNTWHPRLRRLERAYYFNRYKTRLGLLRLAHYTPMGKTSAMFHYLIDKPS